VITDRRIFSTVRASEHVAFALAQDSLLYLILVTNSCVPLLLVTVSSQHYLNVISSILCSNGNEGHTAAPVNSGRKGEERGEKDDEKCEAKENSRRPFMRIMSI